MFKLAPRVRETTATTGTGTLSLAGATPGMQTFVAGIGTTNTTRYCVVSGNGTDWEIGIGTVTAGSPATLSRTTILASTNSNAAIALTGTSRVFCCLDPFGNLSGLTDVAITSPADNHVLRYKNADAQWENESLSALLDAVFSSAQGALLYRGASVWTALPGPTGTDIVLTGDTGGNPIWETLTSILDTIISSTEGAILQRGPSFWQTLAPGTAGQVLTSGGAGALNSWAAGGGGSGGLYNQVLSATPTSASTGLTTWQNQGSATIADGATGMALVAPSNGGNDGLRMRTKAISGSHVYTMLVALAWDLTAADVWGGVGFTDGTKSELILIASRLGGANGPGIYILTYDTNTHQAGTIFTSPSNIHVPLLVWFQLEIDATKVYFRWSMDGATFREIYSVTLAAGYLGATGYNNLALALNPYGVAAALSLLSFNQV